MQYKNVLIKAVEELKKAGVAEADLDARLLLEAACGTDRNTLFMEPEREVSAQEQGIFDGYMSQRMSRIPLQQILHTTNFMGLDFYVNQNVLCPRQDTEILVEEVMPHLHDGMRILDLCTGSGCILLSLMHYSNDCQGVGVDLSPDALEVAVKNANTLFGDSDKISKIDFVQGDLFEGLDHLKYDAKYDTKHDTQHDAKHDTQYDAACEVKYDTQYEIIVSNPPYIKSAVIETLEPEVKDHEPMMALDGTEDGLFFYEKIIAGAPQHLCHGGMLFFEIGYDQGEAVSGMMQAAGFLEVTVKKDYAGLDRVVFGTYI